MLNLWRTYSFYRRYGGRAWAFLTAIRVMWLLRDSGGSEPSPGLGAAGDPPVECR
jgi:hypothetical protein